MLKATINAVLLATLVTVSCQSAGVPPRNDMQPQPVPSDEVGKARFFSNCGIVIRPAVQYEVSYLVSDEAITGRDYIEELTLFISVPTNRAGKLTIHNRHTMNDEPLPTAAFAALPAGITAVNFQLSTDQKSVVWRLNGQGQWLKINNVSAAYDKDSAFKDPEDQSSVKDPTASSNRLLPFKPIKINLYGVTFTIYLRDAN